MMRSVAVLLHLLFAASTLLAREGTLRGRVLDEKNAPFPGAHVRLVDPADTTHVYRATTGDDGKFLLSNIQPETYRVEITAVGHRRITLSVRVPEGALDLLPISLAENAINLGEIVIQGRVPAAIQKGDTTEYIAGAFKTNRDATAEELITKMPGITVDNGTVRAGGENVQRVLVDNKPYFGDDPTLALRNLPAEVIDKIQVFDQMSDQAQFTGFDDGQSVKTMNIQTRRRTMQFGKFTAGYGDDQRYEAGGNINLFDGVRRLSFLGLSNNVNEQNFTTQDILGAISGNSQVRSPGTGPRRGGGGGSGGGGGRRSQPGQGSAGTPNPFLAGQQQGINTNHMLGVNASDSLADNLYAQGSYFGNRTDNSNQQSLNRQYLLGGDSTSQYNQNADVASKNFNHRVNGRVEYAADQMNSFIILPQLYFQANHADNDVNAMSTQSTSSSNSLSTTDGVNSGYDLSGHVVYRHKFDLPGRTISLDLNTDVTRKKTSTTLGSSFETGVGNSLFAQTQSAQQYSSYRADGHTLGASLIYTEPVGLNGQMQLSYTPTVMHNNAGKNTFDFDSSSHSYSIPDIPLSNSYANNYWTQNAGLGLRWRGTDMNMMAGVSYQAADLQGDPLTTAGSPINRRFNTFLPNALVLLTFPEHRSLRIMYRANTRPPTVAQLQNVINNTNPLILSSGNPALDQSHTHSLIARYSETNMEQGRNMFVLLSGTYTAGYIANSALIPSKDTLLADGTALISGTQLTTPVNLDGYWNIRSFFTYGFPFDLVSSTLNLNTGLSFIRTPGLVNSLLNLANSYSLSQGFVLGSNISQEFDFTISYTGNYTIARNTLQSTANSNYYSHAAILKWTWTFWDGIVLRNEVNNSLTSGLAAGYDQNIILWNISLAKKLFADQQGEIRFLVADLLKQNKNVSRSITETYVEDSRNQALSRYILLNFTYTVR